MRFRFTLVFVLLMLAASCVKKSPDIDAEAQNLVRLVSILDQICHVEQRRNGADQSMDFYRNEHMDAYQENPGEPHVLLDYLDASDVVACRGALVQLICRTHPDYLNQNWPKIATKLTASDRIALLNGIRFMQDARPDRVVMALLSPDNEPEVREMAALILSKTDQQAASEQIVGLMKAEQDTEVLLNMLISLDMSKDSGFSQTMTELFEHPDPRVHRNIMMNWSMSDAPEKKQWLQRYKEEHPSREVQMTATSFLYSLEEKDKLDLNVSMTQIDTQQHDEAMGPELENAIKSRDVDRVRFVLMNGANPNGRNKEGKTPLMLATQTGITRNGPVMEELLAHGADVNVADDDGRTAIFHAAMAGSPAATRVLLQYGADTEKTDLNGQTPRDLAEMLEFDQVVAIFDKGAEAALEVHPLHRAAVEGDVATIVSLLEKGFMGPYVDKRNDAGKTPLMLAAQAGHMPVVEVLLARGALPGARDRNGMRAAILAVNEGHSRIFELLRDAEMKQAQALAIVDAVKNNDVAKAEQVLDEGASVHTRNAQGRSLLAEAVFNENMEMVKLLASRGADLSETTSNGHSLEDYCRRIGFNDMADLLAQYKADAEN